VSNGRNVSSVRIASSGRTARKDQDRITRDDPLAAAQGAAAAADGYADALVGRAMSR
jgi:hypothetical protein